MTQVNPKVFRLVTNPRAPQPENNWVHNVIFVTVFRSNLVFVGWD